MPIKVKPIPKLIGYLLFILAAILPIQNILVVFAVNVLGLPSWLALWKEAAIIALIICMLIDLFKNLRFKNINYKWFVGVFGVLNFLVLVSSFVINQTPIAQFVLGYRFELFWLWLWVIGFVWIQNLLHLAHNTPNILAIKSNIQFYQQQLIKGIFLGFGFCLIFTLGQLSLGKDFVQFFGYTDSSLPLATGKINSPICHSIDFGVEACRLSTPFSSPNHLAGYLILVLGMMIFYATNRGEIANFAKQFVRIRFWNLSLVELFHSTVAFFTNFSFLPLSIIISVLIVLTYSRFALFALGLYWIFILLSIFKLQISRIFIILIFATTFIVSLAVTSFDPSWASKILPNFLAKPSSSMEHYRLTGVALDILKSEPSILVAGLGQGASGSSTTYFEPDQNLIYNRYKDISYKWFIKPDRITVPENWYLQLVLNGGLVYTLLYLYILLFPILSQLNQKKLWDTIPLLSGGSEADGVVFPSEELNTVSKSKPYQNTFIFTAFFGIIIGNIFLHLWENQTIAIYWSLVYFWWQFENLNITYAETNYN